MKWREKKENQKEPQSCLRWHCLWNTESRSDCLGCKHHGSTKCWQLYRVREREIHSAIVFLLGVTGVLDGEASRQREQARAGMVPPGAQAQVKPHMRETLRRAKTRSRQVGIGTWPRGGAYRGGEMQRRLRVWGADSFRGLSIPSPGGTDGPRMPAALPASEG